MKAKHPNDRPEMPEECDECGMSVELDKYESYGPGYQVDWLCKYCANSHDKKTTQSMAAMFNVLEQALKDEKP